MKTLTEIYREFMKDYAKTTDKEKIMYFLDDMHKREKAATKEEKLELLRAFEEDRYILKSPNVFQEIKELERQVKNSLGLSDDESVADIRIGASSDPDNGNQGQSSEGDEEHMNDMKRAFESILEQIKLELKGIAKNEEILKDENKTAEEKNTAREKIAESNKNIEELRYGANELFIEEKDNPDVKTLFRDMLYKIEEDNKDDGLNLDIINFLKQDISNPITNNSDNMDPSENNQPDEEKYNYPFAPVSEYKEETFEELDERMKELKYRYNKAKRENDEENMSLYGEEFNKIQEYLNNKNNRLKAFNKSDMKAMDKFAMVGLIDLEKAVNIKNEKKSYSTYTKGVDTALNVDTLEEYLQNNPKATLKIKKKTWKTVAVTIIAAGLTLGLVAGAVKGINKLKNTIDGLYTSDTNDKDNIKDKNKDTQSADANIQENPTEEKTTEEQVEEAIAAIEESSKEENNEIVSSNDSDIPLAKDKKANNDKILLDDYDYSNSNDGNSDYVLVDNNGGSTPSSPLSDNGTPSSPTSNTNETQSNDNLSNNTQETIIPEADAAEEPEAQEYKNITEKTGMEFTYNGAMALEIEINNSTPTNESDDMPIEGQDDHNQPKDEQQAQDSDYKIPAQEIINDGGTINNRIPVNQDESMPIEGEDNNVQQKDEQQAQGSDYTIPEQEIVTEDQLEEHSETPNANQDMPIEGEEQSQLEQTAEEKDSESKDSSEENNDFKLIQYEEDKSEEKIVEEQAADEGEPIDFVGDSLEDYINIISTEEKVNYEEQNENGTYNTDNLEIDENTYILTLTPNN